MARDDKSAFSTTIFKEDRRTKCGQRSHWLLEKCAENFNDHVTYLFVNHLRERYRDDLDTS